MKNKFTKVLTLISGIAISNLSFSENLTELTILDVDIRFTGSYALIRIDKSFTACSEKSYVKLPLNESAASKAAFSTVLAAKASKSKVNILSSSTCDHFNVLERIKLL